MADADTRNKRGSCLLFDLPFARIYPNPDGSLANRGDRQQMAMKYAGILTAAIVTLFDGLTTSLRLTGVGH